MNSTESSASRTATDIPDAHFTMLFEQSPVVMLLISPEDGCIQKANKAACAYYGWSEEELTGKPIYALNTLPANQLQQKIQLAKNAGQKYFEFTHRLADGTIRDVEIHTVPVPCNGTTLLYSSVFDITERKQAQQALQESEKRFRLLYQDAPVAYQSLDEQGSIIEVNNTYCSTLGYTPSDVIGKNFTEILHPECRSHFAGKFAQFKTKGEICEAEFLLQKKDGSTIRVAVNGRVGRHTDGTFRQTYCVLRDITREYAAQKALEESERRFRTILEGLETVAVQGYDEQRRVIYWNKASELLYGYSAQEALGERLEDLIIPDHLREEVISNVHDWMTKERLATPSGELTLTHKNGSNIPVHASHIIQENSNGQKEFYDICVDLREIKETHAQLIRAKEAAEKASRTKSLFLANMSHELRTPLAGISGMHQLLQSTDLDAEQQELLEHAVQSASRLTKLLADILDLSRVESGKLEIQSRPFQLQDALDTTCLLLLPGAQQKGLNLSCTMEKQVPPVLIGDQFRLQQILNNLIGNAIKFTETGNVLCTVSLLPTPQSQYRRLLFTITDTGIGMAEEKLSTLFEAFTQEDERQAKQYQGAGLGLSIVKQLVKRMGGTLFVETETGTGTCFYLMLPFALPADTTTKAGHQQNHHPARSKPCSILVVEDETVNSIFIQRLLTLMGHTATLAADGREALDIMQGTTFDLVLMDIQMPVMDGVKATRMIRQGKGGSRNSTVPIIALTAYAMDGDKERFLAEGMDSYLTKPLERELLENAINTYTC